MSAPETGGAAGRSCGSVVLRVWQSSGHILQNNIISNVDKKGTE